MAYIVTVRRVEPQWIAAARGQIGEIGEKNISKTMLGLLTEAWDRVRQNGIKNDGQSVAIYRDGWIEAGPRLSERMEGSVSTPSGLAAMTVHIGPYELLGSAHRAVREWCSANGHKLDGANWEIYGHHEEDPARSRTDVFYLLRS
jgi:effector-binding domain-containing protein